MDALPQHRHQLRVAHDVQRLHDGIIEIVGQHGQNRLAAPCDGHGASFGRAALGLLAGLRTALPVYVGAGQSDEEGFAAVQRFGGLTVHVGPPPRTGTAARWHVADSREVIRLIHWLADARRRGIR